MQKVYIVVEDKNTGEQLNISGSLELLNLFLKGMININLATADGPLPIDKSKLEGIEVQHVEA